MDPITTTLLATAGSAGLSKLMGGSKTEKPKFYPIPLAPEQRTALSQLTSLMGLTPQIPTREIAGLTPTEQASQELLRKWVIGPTEGYEDVYDELLRTARGEYTDISKAPYYQPLLRDIQRGALGTARRMQIRGMGTSSAGAERVARRVSEDILGAFGPYVEAERGRQMQAISNMINLAMGGPELAKVAAVSQYGGLPRELSQAEADALFNQQMQSVLFPYLYQAPIAQNILSHPFYVGQAGATTPPMGSQVAQMLTALAPLLTNTD